MELDWIWLCQRWQNYISNYTLDASVSFVDNVIIRLCDTISRYVEDVIKLSSYKVFILAFQMREMKIVGSK